MRRLILALPFALLPLAIAQAADEHDHDPQHASLAPHEHGIGRLNAALDGQTLELEFDSPAMNLLGFEHVASTAQDKAKVAAVRAQLEKPLALFGLPSKAGCTVASQELNSPLFGDKPDVDDDHDEDAKDADGHEHHHDHSEIHAHYQLTCATPGVLEHLDLANLFNTFPATQKIQVQLIGPSGQQGVEVTAKAAALKF
ncbi:Protein of unknown function [Pseudomonas sp. ok272]|uniref:DUF2796 domain-containing protein n=1 Tax=unclassified Pseudomonas TaxID=196821 RepID=UPI0008B6134E|nr:MULTISPECIES: DUF2796 domain-containing protein [unclassified Pseudomonas]SEN60751.1 Protein of unknown function [Pseudomonas sp. ok272]SFN39565.1 Protein of unknown function [Pseudomonas sp. ok602]